MRLGAVLVWISWEHRKQHFNPEKEERAIMSEYLSTTEAAEFIGVSINTLAIWRYRGHGPTYYKVGDHPGGAVIYRTSDISAFLKAAGVQPGKKKKTPPKKKHRRPSRRAAAPA